MELWNCERVLLRELIYCVAVHLPPKSLTHRKCSIYIGPTPVQTKVTFNPGIIFEELFFSFFSFFFFSFSLIFFSPKKLEYSPWVWRLFFLTGTLQASRPLRKVIREARCICWGCQWSWVRPVVAGAVSLGPITLGHSWLCGSFCDVCKRNEWVACTDTPTLTCTCVSSQWLTSSPNDSWWPWKAGWLQGGGSSQVHLSVPRVAPWLQWLTAGMAARKNKRTPRSAWFLPWSWKLWSMKTNHISGLLRELWNSLNLY